MQCRRAGRSGVDASAMNDHGFCLHASVRIAALAAGVAHRQWRIGPGNVVSQRDIARFVDRRAAHPAAVVVRRMRTLLI